MTFLEWFAKQPRHDPTKPVTLEMAWDAGVKEGMGSVQSPAQPYSGCSTAHVDPFVQAPAQPLTAQKIREWWASENGLEDMDMCKLDDFETVVRAIEAHIKRAPL